MRRALGGRLARWLLASLLVAGVVVASIVLVRQTVVSQQSDDPRSATRFGAAALSQLLADEGVDTVVVGTVNDAVLRSDVRTTLVVANPARVSPEDARRLMTSPHGRLVLLRPDGSALRAFNIAAAAGPGQARQPLEPRCDESAAGLAGVIRAERTTYSYRPTALAELACYPTTAGFAWLRADGVDLVAGSFTNAELGSEGNAAYAMNVLGSHPDLVWLMAPRAATEAAGPSRPTLLPSWWAPAALQAFVALVILGIWRGRRLGPILTEQLPVRVRGSETVEGHGRLYYRMNARDQAAAVLRAAALHRLALAFGHRDDVEALTAAVAARTSRPSAAIRSLLDGAAPLTDDQLSQLARDLDQLEQEARRL